MKSVKSCENFVCPRFFYEKRGDLEENLRFSSIWLFQMFQMFQMFHPIIERKRRRERSRGNWPSSASQRERPPARASASVLVSVITYPPFQKNRLVLNRLYRETGSPTIHTEYNYSIVSQDWVQLFDCVTCDACDTCVKWKLTKNLINL